MEGEIKGGCTHRRKGRLKDGGRENMHGGKGKRKAGRDRGREAKKGGSERRKVGKARLKRGREGEALQGRKERWMEGKRR